METKNIHQKLSEFQSIVGKLLKDKTNPFFKSKYADINTVLEMIREPFKKLGLSFIQTTQITDSGLPYLETVLYIVNDYKEHVVSDTLLVLAKQDMQGLGSAITYARRYALVSMLGLEQEDDDANRSVGSQTLKGFDPSTEIVGIGQKYKNKLWIDMTRYDLDFIISDKCKTSKLVKDKARKTIEGSTMKSDLTKEDIIGEQESLLEERK